MESAHWRAFPDNCDIKNATLEYSVGNECGCISRVREHCRRNPLQSSAEPEQGAGLAMGLMYTGGEEEVTVFAEVMTGADGGWMLENSGSRSETRMTDNTHTQTWNTGGSSETQETVVSIYQKCSKEGTVVNQRQSHGWPRLIDARGERRLARVVQSNRRATVAKNAQEVNAGSDRKVSEYTVHHSLLRMGLHSRRPVRVPMLTPVHRQTWVLLSMWILL
ncbi:hypothetical protein DPX16_9480 [Anabarilius grahami]|uniref:Transposase Tc1-like domain-containing protein n=1 Tax=Anabarilius grahami TaxID=495550 RepID=A0A3N0Z5N0_ANAGA|nr:hypothetical protein DPX16_9480 [Anabarilius grahami]